jgi:hypothetical protein
MDAATILSLIVALAGAIPSLLKLLTITPGVTQEQIDQAMAAAAAAHAKLQGIE